MAFLIHKKTNSFDVVFYNCFLRLLNTFYFNLSLLQKVQSLLKLHDELKKEESEFKEHCRKDLADLQQQIE